MKRALHLTAVIFSTLVLIHPAALAKSAYGYFECEATNGSEQILVMSQVAQFEYEFEEEAAVDDIKKLMSQMNEEERAFTKQVTSRWSRTFTNAVRERFGSPCQMSPPSLIGPYDSSSGALEDQRESILAGIEARQKGTSQLHYQVIEVQFQ